MADGSSRGARVLRTGIALVHEGELVLPAVGSEAQAEQVLDDARASGCSTTSPSRSESARPAIA